MAKAKSIKKAAKEFFMAMEDPSMGNLIAEMIINKQKNPIYKQIALGLMEALDEREIDGKGRYSI